MIQFVALLLLLIALPAQATNYYIAETAAGNGNGTSCANAKQGKYPGNWNWAGVTGDDTVWICGTVNLDASSQVSVGASGTSASHPVTLKFCSVTDCGAGNVGLLTAPYSGNMLNCVGYQYVVVDGNGVGIIQATTEGTGLASKNNTTVGVYSECSNFEVKNLTIRNLYVHTYGSEDSTSPESRGIYIKDSSAVKVHDNVISNVGRGIMNITTGGTQTGVEIYNNTITNACWGMGLGTGNTAGAYNSGRKIYSNTIQMGGNWVGESGCHLNGTYTYSSGSGSGFGALNQEVYNNYVYGPSVSPGGNWTSTSMIGWDGYGENTGEKIYNNLVAAGAYSNPGPTNGAINSRGDIYNNTLIGDGITPAIAIDGPLTQTIQNNIMQGWSVGIQAPATFLGTSNYNSFYGNVTGDVRLAAGIPKSLATWKTDSGQDANSIDTNPDLNVDYTPKVTSPVKWRGTTPLTSTDKVGVTWHSPPSMGAYEYGAGGGTTTTPTSIGGVSIGGKTIN